MSAAEVRIGGPLSAPLNVNVQDSLCVPFKINLDWFIGHNNYYNVGCPPGPLIFQERCLDLDTKKVLVQTTKDHLFKDCWKGRDLSSLKFFSLAILHLTTSSIKPWWFLKLSFLNSRLIFSIPRI